MNKKFLSAILFGALMVSSTGTFVSCKDYDDDIDQINQKLDGVEATVADLQKKIGDGAFVKWWPRMTPSRASGACPSIPTRMVILTAMRPLTGWPR